MDNKNSTLDTTLKINEKNEQDFCKEHERYFECFCKICLDIICPSCLMFGKHKGHEVCTIDEAKEMIEEDININVDKGLFDKENIQKLLLDIRYSKFKCEEIKEKLKNEIITNFEKIIKKLQNRKFEILKLIENEFNDINVKINKTEEKWINNKKNSTDIINLIINKDNNKIDYLNKAKEIYKFLDFINKEKDKVKIDFPNNLDFEFDLIIDKKLIKFTINDLLISIDNFVKPNSFIKIEYYN